MDQVILVGGSVPATWDTGPGDIRPTEDIDLVVRGGYIAFDAFQRALRERGFRDPMRGHICRLERDGLLVDVVPAEGGSIAENPWYVEAWDSAKLNADLGIRVITPGLFVATKLQAFSNPERVNGGDHYGSHDLEDVVRMLRDMPGALEDLQREQSRAHRYARFELRKIASRPDGLDILRAHTEADAPSRDSANRLLAEILGLPE